MTRPDLGPVLAIVFMMIGERQSVVLHMTSSIPQEGTTTVARELAAAAAGAHWCKVALLDARPVDAHDPAAARPGLVEQFERGEELDLQPHRINAAQVMTGRLSTGSRAVTRMESVRGLYRHLRANFALIVVDCPAVLSTQDRSMLAGLADGAMLVVEAERTPLADITRARETLEQFGASLLGVVLNKHRRRTPHPRGRAL